MKPDPDCRECHGMGHLGDAFDPYPPCVCVTLGRRDLNPAERLALYQRELEAAHSALVQISLAVDGPKVGGSSDPVYVWKQVERRLVRHQETVTMLEQRLAILDRGECLRCADARWGEALWHECVQDMLALEGVSPDVPHIVARTAAEARAARLRAALVAARGRGEDEIDKILDAAIAADDAAEKEHA